MSADFKDLQCQTNVSDYKWLSKTLKTAQQQSAVRPFYECKIIDDSILGDVVTNPATPLQGSACIAPDGNMFAVGLDSSNNVAVWKGDTSVLSGAPTSILENVAGNRSPFNNYSIACSDWIAGSYKLDVYFFGDWASANLTILHYYSMDKGVTWHTDQAVNTTGINGSFYVSINKHVMWISAGKPFQNDAGAIISTVFYIERTSSSDIYFMIKHQQYLGSGGAYETSVPWSRIIDSCDWQINSLDNAYINGFFYVVFSGFHKIFDSTNQNTTTLNNNIYITKIASFSNALDANGNSESVWTPPEQIISALSTSSQNQNNFTLPNLFYDETSLWIFFKGETVTSVTNSNGSLNVATTTNYLLAKSIDFKNFSYPVPVVFSNVLFSDTVYYSFFLFGNFYWIAGGGQLGKFIINNIMADITNDIISYQERDTQQNPSTLSINIGNANGKWRGANPTQAGYQAIANNKKITLFQGYYNANGVAETVPKNTFYIDDIQQNVKANRNDFSLLGRDFYKGLKVLKTKFAFNYMGIKKCVDLFDGSALSNWYFQTGTWNEVAGAINYLTQTNTAVDSLAIFSLFQQTKANTTFSISMQLMDPASAAGKPLYIYFYYVNLNNYLRLYVDSNGGSTTYSYKIQQVVGGVSTDLYTGTFPAGTETFPFLFTRRNFFQFTVFVGNSANSGLGINAYSSNLQLGSTFDGSFVFSGLATIALGSLNQSTTFYNFKYLEFDSSLKISELLQKIATKSGVFEYKLPITFKDYLFDNYSGIYTIPNRILTIGASQTVLKNDLQIDNSEIEFEARMTPLAGASTFKFSFFFRHTGLVNNNETYFFLITQTDSGVTTNTIEFYNTHSGVDYLMSISSVNLHFDFKKYHKFRVVFFNGYIFLIIDGVVVYGWVDNNITASGLHTTGYIGFKTEPDTKLEVKSVEGDVLYSQIETFSINPGDDLENSIESLLDTIKAYFFSDLLGRCKVLKLNSTDPSEYTYQDQITSQMVDNSDKEYVNQVTVVGTNVQATVQDATSINNNSIVREEIIVDYKITTYQDAVDRANLELVAFNKFNNQYNPRNVINVGSEIYDVVTVINTGDNTSNVNEVVRNYSQNIQVGGNKLNFWQEIQTGKL